MKLAVPKEIVPGEKRVALVPESVKKLVKAGLIVAVQNGAGDAAFTPDAEFTQAGAAIVGDVGSLLRDADIVLKAQPPVMNPDLGVHEASLLKSGSILITTMRSVLNLESVRRLTEANVTVFATDAIPRLTRAQSMDTLSSMGNIAGYRGVLLAAMELPKYLPMFMTAAGTVHPAKVFVIGAGVAGLQAIATAKRLGAVLEATDTRPAVRTEVESLGAKFVGVTSDEAQDKGGYAKELSAEFYRKQGELIAGRCAASDVVITTALIGGVKAPKLITEDMVKAMKPGSVIVDLAAEGGGNCTLCEPGRTVVKHGVKIMAPLNLPAEMPVHASTLYSRNLTTFVLAFWKDNTFQLDFADEILKGAVITHGGQVMHGPTREAMQRGG